VRLATWNVNSARARAPRLVDWLDRVQPDVACLQETKVGTEEFAELFDGDLTRRGYAWEHHGDGRWNGVALLSRVGLSQVRRGFAGEPAWEGALETRAISAVLAEGTRVWSLYVPNGRSIEDPHLAYKLRWLPALRAVVEADLAAGVPTVACGDFNIAPADVDVWDPADFAASTHVTPAERGELTALEQLGLQDLVRRRWPAPQRVYSYWDYRAGMFHTDKGMRIDLLLASPTVADRLAAAWVDRQARKGTGPSDHAPVVVDLDTAPSGDIGPVVPPPSLRGRR